MTKNLFIRNDGPYGTGRSYNALRVAGALSAREGEEVRVFHLAGSLLFGIGWALSGTYPGPAAAQLGRGQLAALFTLAGIFAGVALFGYLKRRREAAAASPATPDLVGAGPGR